MRLSPRAEYALRALVELAGAAGGVVPAEQLARDQAIPGRLLELVMTELRRAGLVDSQRGPQGGFSLARSADRISLAEVVSVINGPRLLGDHLG
ncbi:MAG: RrF2 family transcriptional regulator [Streptosporangiaceae bacterium]